MASLNPPSRSRPTANRVATVITSPPRQNATACSVSSSSASYVPSAPNHSGWSRRSRSARLVTSNFSALGPAGAGPPSSNARNSAARFA